MYSRIAHFFDGWNFGDFRGILFAAVVASCARVFLKYAWRRRNYVRDFPSKKVSLFNVWGSVADFKNTARKDGVRLDVYMLQVLMGYMQLFKNESFFYFGLSYIPMIVVTKAKAVEDLISGSKNMQKNWIYDWLHPWLGTGLLTSHGSKWKTRRKLLTNSFHFDILKDFLHIFNEQSQLLVELLEKETKQPWIDIVQPITLCSLDIVCETTLGVTIGAQKNSESEYVQAVLRASESIMTRLTNPLYYINWYYTLSRDGCQFQKDVKLLHSFTRGVIASKKQKLLSAPKETKGLKKRKALMDLLLEEHVQNGSLSEEDIREEVDTFAFEGHDTTSMGISWALYLIGLHRDVQEKLAEEIYRIFGDDYERPVTTDDLNDAEYLERVLKESQRLYPSVPFFARKLSEDTIIDGMKVPKDVGVMVLTYGLHRDENVFPNPEKFDPDRFLPENATKRSPFAYVPFSAGPRNCIDAMQVLAGLHELFKKENFFYFGLSYIPFLLLTKAKAVEEFISGPKNNQKNWLYDWLHPWIGTGLLTSHGSKWKSRRKLLTPAFHFDILKDFLPIFNEQSQLLVQLLEKETKQPWIDIKKPITLCSLDIVCETTLGASVGAQKNNESEYVQAVSRVSEAMVKRVIYPPYYIDWLYHLSSEGYQFKKDLKLLHNFTRSVINDKKQKLLYEPKGAKDNSDRKRKALMDLMLEEHIKDETFTEEDIREEVDTFTFEGHDTTSAAMSWALYLIGLYKEVQEQIIEEIDRIFGDDIERPVTTEDLKHAEYLDRALKESLRLYPSVFFIARRLGEDIELCGVKVPKDVGIGIFTYGIHRDESVYPNPEKFDPDRFLPENSAKRSPYAFVPFSAGPRNCIGQRFAIMEEKVVIINVLRNFRIESLDPRDKVLGALGLILKPLIPVRIKLTSRRGSTS